MPLPAQREIRAKRGEMPEHEHPEKQRMTLCISSQVGCTLTCSFCHTGTQALVRNLTAGEIVGLYGLVGAGRSRRAFEHVQIAVAHAARHGADAHLARARVVDLDVFDRERLVVGAEDGGFHGVSRRGVAI